MVGLAKNVQSMDPYHHLMARVAKKSSSNRFNQ